MILAADGKPYTEAELRPPKQKEPCPGCGSVAGRHVAHGFGRTWRIVCAGCGYEHEHGKGDLPDRLDE